MFVTLKSVGARTILPVSTPTKTGLRSTMDIVGPLPLPMTAETEQVFSYDDPDSAGMTIYDGSSHQRRKLRTPASSMSCVDIKVHRSAEVDGDPMEMRSERFYS